MESESRKLFLFNKHYSDSFVIFRDNTTRKVLGWEGEYFRVLKICLTNRKLWIPKLILFRETVVSKANIEANSGYGLIERLNESRLTAQFQTSVRIKGGTW